MKAAKCALAGAGAASVALAVGITGAAATPAVSATPGVSAPLVSDAVTAQACVKAATPYGRR
jgi:F0F1-type ATP synthase membrane subunit c/vacuolar-type H+-ATPase subunit K